MRFSIRDSLSARQGVNQQHEFQQGYELFVQLTLPTTAPIREGIYRLAGGRSSDLLSANSHGLLTQQPQLPLNRGVTGKQWHSVNEESTCDQPRKIAGSSQRLVRPGIAPAFPVHARWSSAPRVATSRVNHITDDEIVNDRSCDLFDDR